ncbi:hypothetical protein [Aliiroseovarius sp. F47248L]|uniref:hypothetical protein n=1 Tax=Aliiroseovarius sp. F47248L TaxID=2926420 RepID=UPI001FF4473E|nr:hypothetical protein [Aliiroseovarius sp. F47248L]MCK0140601.1 hypothetical protein [Aliiroseovarius sp. F47248L]
MSDTEKPTRGVLLKARNGDVIGFDETGLRMRLSDEVMADISRRVSVADSAAPVDPSVLGDIHAWDVRRAGDWYLFSAHLPGEQGICQFRKRVEPLGDTAPDILANPSGSLFAILSIGGTRRATTSDEVLRYPYHIVTTGDDLGPAGASGTEIVVATPDLQCLSEQSRDSLIADEVIARRHSDFRALPVIYARSETDNSASISDFGVGRALENFTLTVANLCAAANSLGVSPKVLGVGLDFTLEALDQDGAVWRSGIYDIMARVTDIFADNGLRKPLFVSTFDAGTRGVSDNPILRAQWEMAWNKAGHDHVFSAPGYMFAQDEFGRPTAEARQQIAEMDAFAIEALNADQDWSCPVLLLAEREDDPKLIRCRGQALGAFVLDPDDLLNAGPECGFRIEGCENGAKITGVMVDRGDPNDLLISFDIAPEGDGLTLCYALGHPASPDHMPANRGAMRDEWHATSRTGRILHRWALPAALPVH